MVQRIRRCRLWSTFGADRGQTVRRITVPRSEGAVADAARAGRPWAERTGLAATHGPTAGPRGLVGQRVSLQSDG